MACYDNIIGLSRNTCQCVPAAPENYNTSLSGLYLDELPLLDSLSGYEKCGVGTVWDMLSRARASAVSTFISDTNSLLMSRYSTRMPRFSGDIGEGAAKTKLTTSSQYAGARIATRGTRGATMKITKIGTLFSAVGSVTLKIFNSLNEQVGDDIELETKNGFMLNALATPISLPMYIPFAPTQEYFLVFEYNDANKPGLNTIDCRCGHLGETPWYNTANPHWGRKFSEARGWARWVMVGGWSGDTLTEFDQCDTSTRLELNGLTFSVEIGCDLSQVLCKETLDFNNDPLALTMAYAIRYQSGVQMASSLLTSTELLRANTINRDALKAMRSEWQDKYVEYCTSIADNAAIGQNDCLACKDEYGMRTETILS